MIGGREFPDNVGSVMSGVMQRRVARVGKRRETAELVHPDYVFSKSIHTDAAIRGAFTLRLIGEDGKTTEELEDYDCSSEVVPNLEHLGGDPVTYRRLWVAAGISYLKITKLALVEDGEVTLRDQAVDMLSSYPRQPYTILPTEILKHTRRHFGGPVAAHASGPDVAARVYQQYSRDYPPVRPVRPA